MPARLRRRSLGFVWLPVLVFVALTGLMIPMVRYVTDPNSSFDIRKRAMTTTHEEGGGAAYPSSSPKSVSVFTPVPSPVVSESSRLSLASSIPSSTPVPVSVTPTPTVPSCPSENTKKCDGNILKICMFGQWQLLQNCATYNKICTNNECVALTPTPTSPSLPSPTASPIPSVTPGPISPTGCSGENQQPTVAKPCCGGLVTVASPYGYYCAKQGECTPGMTKCSQYSGKDHVYTCGSNGYYTPTNRCDFGCTNGRCLSACSPSQTKCEGSVLKTCNNDGSAWGGKSCSYGCEVTRYGAGCRTTPVSTPLPSPDTDTSPFSGVTGTVSRASPKPELKAIGVLCGSDSECQSGRCQLAMYGQTICVGIDTPTEEDLAKQKEESLVAAGRALNMITFGAFGDYVATQVEKNQEYNYGTEEFNYWARTLDPESLASSAKLGTVVTAEAAAIYFGAAALPAAYAGAGNLAATGLVAVQTTPALATAVEVIGTVGGIAGAAVGTRACFEDPGSDLCAAFVTGNMLDPQMMQQLGASAQRVGSKAVQAVSSYIDDAFTFLPETGLTGINLDEIEDISDMFTGRGFDSSQSRLAEHITGYSTVESELLAGRVADDHFVIRAKYGLPPRELRINDPREYIRQMEGIAQENQIVIRPPYEVETFFEQNVSAGAVAFDNGSISIRADLARSSEIYEVKEYASALEHEIIHQLQTIRYPGMPVEAMEYEAYVSANLGPEYLIENPDYVNVLFGDFRIGGSSSFWYRENKIIPPWLDN